MEMELVCIPWLYAGASLKLLDMVFTMGPVAGIPWLYAGASLKR